MNEASKAAILATPLSDLGIKGLATWSKRGGLQLRQELSYWQGRCQNPSRQDVNDKPQERLAKCQRRLGINTVGDLIRVYPYRFVMKWYEDGSVKRLGLGRDSIIRLKQVLVDLGLTPDDWPALVEHDELLVHLSKDAILKLPFQEVFTANWHQGSLAQFYFDCDPSQLPSKTVADFIAIDPLTRKEHYASSLFQRCQRQLIALRQKLAAKGVTLHDGAFMKWDPDKESLVKAMKVLEKYPLKDADRASLAEVIVAERWVW